MAFFEFDVRSATSLGSHLVFPMRVLTQEIFVNIIRRRMDLGMRMTKYELFHFLFNTLYWETDMSEVGY